MMNRDTRMLKEIFRLYGLDKKLSTAEVKHANKKRLASSPLYRECYFDKNPVSWEIANKLQSFLESIESDPENASKILIDLAPQEGNEAIINSKHVLGRLRSYAKLSYLTTTERIRIFEVLSNSADELSKSFGPPEPMDCTIAMSCFWAVQESIAQINSNVRISTILKRIENGSAFSWLMYFVHHIMKEHNNFERRWVFRRIRYNDSELTKIRSAALDRINSSLSDIYQSSDPLYIFRCWYDLSDDKKQLLDWVEKHIQSNYNLVNFTRAFRVIGIGGKSRLIWKLHKHDLGKFVDIAVHRKRLSRVADGDSDLQEPAEIMFNELKSIAE